MLKLQNLSISQDQTALFHALNVTFKPGQFWGIIGQNGVGKSTLLRTIAGINKPLNGAVLIDGSEVATMQPQLRAQKFSYLFQEQEATLAFSVRAAVGMGRYPWHSKKADDNEITEHALQLCGIQHLADKSILRLSGGERRKVEIATCITQQSDFLLLDEPLNHLDLVYKSHILNVFSEISEKRCVVMVCHDLEVVKKHCTHVMMLFANDCYLTGTSATILTDANIGRLFNDHHQYD